MIVNNTANFLIKWSEQTSFPLKTHSKTKILVRGRKSKSPHNFSMETRKGLHGFGLRAADRGSQDSPTLSRQRERDCLRPLGKQTVSKAERRRSSLIIPRRHPGGWNQPFRLSLKQIKKYRLESAIENKSIPIENKSAI